MCQCGGGLGIVGHQGGTRMGHPTAGHAIKRYGVTAFESYDTRED
jgi:hypothetical protein